MTTPIFIDANIPLYAGGGQHPLKTPCSEIIRAAARTSGQFTTDAEVLQEVLHVSRRGGRAASGRSTFDNFLGAIGRAVLPMERIDLALAADLADRYGTGPSTRDLVHAAVMMRHGIEAVVTADKHFDGMAGITRLDPTRLDEWADPDWFPKD